MQAGQIVAERSASRPLFNPDATSITDEHRQPIRAIGSEAAVGVEDYRGFLNGLVKFGWTIEQIGNAQRQ